MPLAAGQNLGHYRIVEQIGRGGMATVYKAYQPSLSRHVAIKVLPALLVDDPQFLERFRLEAKAVASLDHSNILPIYDFDEDDGLAYIVTKLVDGGTLSDKIGPAIPVHSSVHLLRPVASALDFAHRAGIIHRDVKPGNVLLHRDGTPVLADFGLARMFGNTAKLTSTGMTAGTPEYMAPEQALGGEVGPAADIYALAATLYEMLTASVPFQADTPLAVALAQVHNPLPLPRDRNPDLSERVQDVLLKGLAKEPAARFATASDMVDALEAAGRADAGLDDSATFLMPAVEEPSAALALRDHSLPPSAAPKRGGVLPAVVGIVLLLLIAGLGGGAFAMFRGVLGGGRAAAPAPSSAPASAPPAVSPAAIAGGSASPGAAPSDAAAASAPASAPAASAVPPAVFASAASTPISSVPPLSAAAKPGSDGLPPHGSQLFELKGDGANLYVSRSDGQAKVRPLGNAIELESDKGGSFGPRFDLSELKASNFVAQWQLRAVGGGGFTSLTFREAGTGTSAARQSVYANSAGTIEIQSSTGQGQSSIKTLAQANGQPVLKPDAILAVLASGPDLVAYLNGREVLRTRDNTAADGGMAFQMQVSQQSPVAFLLRVLQLRVWTLPDSSLPTPSG